MLSRLRCIFFTVPVLCLALACSRGGDPGGTGGGGIHVEVPHDTTAPQIQITTPSENQQFSTGSPIQVSGKVTDDYGLYRGSIRITNDATGASLLDQPYVIHGLMQYNFAISHTANVNTASNYTVTVSFEDHGSNTNVKTVKIKVNP